MFLKKNFIIILTLAICSGSWAAKKKSPNDELKVGISQEFENLNPLVMSMLATTYIYKAVGRTMMVLNPDSEYEEQLIKEIPSLEKGTAKFIGKGDKQQIKFDIEIKPNAFWGDGKPVTCEDIKFSWQVALSKNISIGERTIYDQVKSITIDPKNKRKCTFVNEKRWDFYQKPQFYIVPKHLEEKVFNKYKNEPSGYEKNSNYSINPTNPGLYNGPYRISEIKLGSHVTLVPNKYFYGKKPKIKKVVFRLIPNTGTMEANLRSDTINMISVLGVSFDQALAFEKKIKTEKLPFKVNFKQSLVYEHIDLNLRNPILTDVKVRKALVHAINRDELTKALFEGRQTPALHNMTPSDPWFTDDPNKIVIYSYSRRKAKKLLDEAGWKLQKDGYRYKDGKKLSLSLMTTAGNKVRELVQVFLKDQWKQVGVDITIKNEPARVYFGETVRKAKYDAMAMYAWISSPENNPRATLHTKNIPTKENNYSGQNSCGYSNKEVDKYIEKIDVEFDAKKRTELAHKILYHYTNDVPVIPLYYRSDVSVTGKNFAGYRLPGHQFSATNHIEEWHFK